MAEPDEETSAETLERIAREYKHRQWLKGRIKLWAQWIGAISVGATVLNDWIHWVIKYIRGPSG